MKVLCPECDTRETLAPDRWRCDCGGAWEPAVPIGRTGVVPRYHHVTSIPIRSSLSAEDPHPQDAQHYWPTEQVRAAP
jgi:hypothetical protein